MRLSRSARGSHRIALGAIKATSASAFPHHKRFAGLCRGPNNYVNAIVIIFSEFLIIFVRRANDAIEHRAKGLTAVGHRELARE